MRTDSTRSQAHKRAGERDKPRPGGGASASATELTIRESAEGAEVSERAWQVVSILILVVAAVLRLYNLGLVPLHHDEGVNGSFLTRLVREGFYQYDPANYHGPTLYYFALVTSTLFGLNTSAIRLVPAIFGIATVYLVLCLRRHLGSVGALAAAALLAVSPGAVYMSRYFIHESLFVFFTLGLVYAALRYYEDAHPVYLMLAAASAALLFATKETAMISAGVLLIALACAYVYMRIRNYSATEAGIAKRVPRSSMRVARKAQDHDLTLTRFGGPSSLALLALAAVAVFLVISLLFYSSFFTNYPKGVYDALETFKFWTKTGKKEHVHEWFTYLVWLWKEESPLLVLGAVGACFAVWRANNRFALFAALWAFGLLAAYSLIPYKTPWLTLNFILPLAIIGGYAVDVIYRKAKSAQETALVLALIVVAVIICGYQMIVLNFIHYDDDRYIYVYAHTRRELLPLVDEVELIAKRAGTGLDTGVTIVSPDYWPLPWYFRDYKRIGYYGRLTPTNEPVVIGSEAQEYELQSTLGDRYHRVNSGLNPNGTYTLRPGVNLVLYVRRDLAGH